MIDPCFLLRKPSHEWRWSEKSRSWALGIVLDEPDPHYIMYGDDPCFVPLWYVTEEALRDVFDPELLVRMVLEEQYEILGVE